MQTRSAIIGQSEDDDIKDNEELLFNYRPIGVQRFVLGDSLSRADGQEEGDLKKPEEKTDVTNNCGLTHEQAAILLKRVGKNEVLVEDDPNLNLLLKSLFLHMPPLLSVAALIEAVIGHWVEMGILIGVVFVNCLFGLFEARKARFAMDVLKKALRPMVPVKRRKRESDVARFVEMDPVNLVPGDCILLTSGAGIPADCRLNYGTITVDDSDFNPYTMDASDNENNKPLMGARCIKGDAEATVEKTGKNTELGSWLLVSMKRAKLDRTVLKITFVCVFTSLVVSAIILVYLLVEGETVKSTLSFAVVLLIASLPLGVDIVRVATLALGSQDLLYNGVSVRRFSIMEDLASLNLMCIDKQAFKPRSHYPSSKSLFLL